MDVLIAVIIMGSLIVTAMTVDSNTRSHVIKTTQDLSNQESARVITDIIEEDFRKIGHGLINPFAAIALADSSHIIFSYDRDPSTAYDSLRVEYFLAPALSTPNPYDKKLVRRVNGQTVRSAALGVARFKLKYYNQYGVLLPTPVAADSLSKIREIELRMVFKSPVGFKRRYARASYITRFTPKNLLIKYGSSSIGVGQE